MLVPGLFNSGSEHWQSIWERELPIFRRIEQRNWSNPDIHRWIRSIRHSIEHCTHPAILVGHSLGALASCAFVAKHVSSVVALLLVAPAEPARFEAEASVPHGSLRVPSVVVASRNDPFMTFRRAEHWASVWGSELVDLGEAGHINAETGFGRWTFGRELLARLVARVDEVSRS